MLRNQILERLNMSQGGIRSISLTCSPVFLCLNFPISSTGRYGIVTTGEGFLPDTKSHPTRKEHLMSSPT
jgi:hypothetical protein